MNATVWLRSLNPETTPPLAAAKQWRPCNTDEAGLKKHSLSVIGDSEKHSVVRVGGMGGHPMKKAHSIEWVEIISLCGAHHRRFLNTGDESESWFLPPVEHVMKARAYCGKHGLWKWEKQD